MEPLFVAVLGTLIGWGLRYLIKGRESYGAWLMPAIGFVAASLVSVILTALRLAGAEFFAWDGGWIWGISLGASALAAIALALGLRNSRERSDARRLIAYAHPGGAPARATV